VSGAEKRAPWESPCKLFNSDLEQSVSSISSSGIQSGLWESTLSSLTRATSPVSSIYSNVVPTCDQQFLKESLTEEKYAKSQQCKMMEFSHFTMNADNQPLKSSMNTGEYGESQAVLYPPPPFLLKSACPLMTLCHIIIIFKIGRKIMAVWPMMKITRIALVPNSTRMTIMKRVNTHLIALI
jgi:hypothetical protein